MFPKEVIGTKGISWDQYYEKLRATMRGNDHNLRREILLWAIVKLQFDILDELRKRRPTGKDSG